MTGSDAPMRESRRPGNSGIWKLVLPVGACFLALVLGEVALRLVGYRSWASSPSRSIVVEPGGRFFQRDDVLGYRHLPGIYSVTLASGYVFRVTHDGDALRVTEPIDNFIEDRPRPEVWVFGGSFTYGWSVHDNETFVWRLQEVFPSFRFVNFGVSGYGTLQSLLQLKRALGEGRRPSAIILAHSTAHAERNTFLRARRKAVAAWNHLGPLDQPVARLQIDGSLITQDVAVSYKPLPFSSWLASANLLDDALNRLLDGRTDSETVTDSLIASFSRRCRSENIPLVVAGIYKTGELSSSLQSVQSRNDRAVEIAVDLLAPGMSNRPHDSHPSARAHELYAERLAPVLQEALMSF